MRSISTTALTAATPRRRQWHWLPKRLERTSPNRATRQLPHSRSQASRSPSARAFSSPYPHGPKNCVHLRRGYTTHPRRSQGASANLFIGSQLLQGNLALTFVEVAPICVVLRSA